MRQWNTAGLFNYSCEANNSLGTNFTSSNTTFTVQVRASVTRVNDAVVVEARV